MRFLSLILLSVALSPASAADPRVGLRPAYGVAIDNRVESIAPPVIERGKTTRVSFTGRDLGTAFDLWHSLPPGSLRAVPVRSSPQLIVMDITASADAPVGICGVRVATNDGLTNACLFLVDDLPVRTTVAKSDTPLPATVWGTFLNGTVDRYAIDVKAGERIAFEAVGNRFGKNADPLIVIRDAAGRKVAERDNDPGLYFDFRFEHRFAASGRYTVEVRDARFKASEHHHYVLRMGRFPAGRVAVPSALEAGFPGEIALPEVPGSGFALGMPRTQIDSFFADLKRPGDMGSTWVPVAPSLGPVTVAEEFDAARDSGLSQAVSAPTTLAFLLSPGFRNPFPLLDRSFTLGRMQATPARIPGTLCGVLRHPGRSDAFQLHLNKGERIFVRGEARSLNSPTDLELSLGDRSGRVQRRVGGNAQTHEEASFDFTAPNAGEYALIVRDAIRDGGDAFAYRVAVRHAPFPPQLTAEVEGLTIPQGSHQPIPITVARNGYGGSIQLHLIGGAGLKLVPNAIGEKETAVVCRLEANAAAPLGVQTIQIIAETDGPNGPERRLVRTTPLIDMKWQNIDLIPIALREDQTRLPPGLADRFAVQVAPPAPFSFELPEAAIVLPRYQSAAIRVATTRIAGFDGPIEFAARGGQLAEKEEGRTRVYAEFPPATREHPHIRGAIVSKILSNVGRTRIEVTATARHQGRRVQLTRTFELDLTTAFRFSPETARISLLPGETTRATIALRKHKSFDAPVTLHFSPMAGAAFPENVTVPKGQTSVAIDIAVSADAAPRKQSIAVRATGDVDGFEEEIRGAPIEIEVKKPPARGQASK